MERPPRRYRRSEPAKAPAPQQHLRRQSRFLLIAVRVAKPTVTLNLFAKFVKRSLAKGRSLRAGPAYARLQTPPLNRSLSMMPSYENAAPANVLPLRFTIRAVRNLEEMPMATSQSLRKMRAEYKAISKTMPHLHIRLYDGDRILEEHTS
ncbi:MAG: hypothetical protein BGO93_08480 [Mesorhizobium sp. 65-26]|nr:MAG: hypothetical protein BGO93_08480 [Mesorhizobium sp. 65-26]